MRQILKDHLKRYPLSEPLDYLKLLYQSEFGGGHLIENPQWSLDYILREMSEMAPAQTPGLEPIGGGLCRLHLQALELLKLRPETVNGLFLEACRPRGTAEGLQQKLDLLAATFPDLPGLNEAIAGYRAAGCPSVRHTPAYREAYHPAYRLVPESAATFLPLFQAIDALLRRRPFVRIAIDGRCASGKSTLGALLARVYGANLIHMDDYFLPFPRKTPERLAQPGGNVDYERFAEEIVAAPKDAPLTYRPFDCSTQSLQAPVTLPPTPLTIVEGSYSLHPTLQAHYDLKVFLSVDSGVQSARILERNGPAMHKRFITEWIPMEETYFSACSVRELCDLVFEL